MKLIVGLGNPGRKYAKTRHNVGFDVVAELSQRYGTGKPKTQFEGETVDAEIAGNRVMLLAPQTYMNNSGRSVRGACDFYRIPPESVLVVCDDMNLPLGKLRIRNSGTAGGQKGLADILRHLGTNDVPRLRLGIDRPPPNWEGTDYVLGKFTKSDRETMDEAVRAAADAAMAWITHGLDYAMNRYNA